MVAILISVALSFSQSFPVFAEARQCIMLFDYGVVCVECEVAERPCLLFFWLQRIIWSDEQDLVKSFGAVFVRQLFCNKPGMGCAGNRPLQGTNTGGRAIG
ncbi:hypothetical protein BGP75_25560 [Motiliproteus sp. MSK22-1]|nr:hypothetical protein BGP75_25560 [Motiliproteus sp. MSK22-1]